MSTKLLGNPSSSKREFLSVLPCHSCTYLFCLSQADAELTAIACFVSLIASGLVLVYLDPTC